MKKNYREYTVGELLDMGLDVDVYNHNKPSEEEAEQLLSRFGGIRRESYTLEEKDGSRTEVLEGFDVDFEITNFLGAKK